MAAEQGDIDSQYMLASLYRRGAGVKQDMPLAARWFSAAAEQGDRAAQANLAEFYANGYGVTQNYATAAKWYREAARKGDTDSQFSLGLLYHQGRGVVQDFALAMQLYQEAAEKGHIGIINRPLYQNGEALRGISSRLNAGIKWQLNRVMKMPSSSWHSAIKLAMGYPWTLNRQLCGLRNQPTAATSNDVITCCSL